MDFYRIIFNIHSLICCYFQPAVPEKTISPKEIKITIKQEVEPPDVEMVCDKLSDSYHIHILEAITGGGANLFKTNSAQKI